MNRLGMSAAAVVLALSASAAWAQQQSVGDIERHAWPSIVAGESLSRSLTGSSTLRDDNTYADVYTYNAQAGETVTFTMRSSDVDSWLVVDEVNGSLYEHDDDSGGGHDAQLTVTFPRSGPYLVFANTVEPKATGHYTFSVTRGGNTVASTSSGPAGDWPAMAQQLMDQAAREFGKRGYSPSGFVHDGQLESNGTDRIPVHLSAGANQLMGACDSNCSDMDLELIDDSGNVVASDLEMDDFPIVSIGRGGDFFIKVVMADCKGSCRYEVRAWNK